MNDLGNFHLVLQDIVLEIPTGDPENPAIRTAQNHIQSFVAAEYLVEVEPGKYKYTSAGIAHIIATSEPCDGPPPGSILLNAKVPPRTH
jgi:hypothetical protein